MVESQFERGDEVVFYDDYLDECLDEREPSKQEKHSNQNLSLDHTEENTDSIPGRLPPFPHILRHPIQALFWTIRASFGMVSLVILLAVLAAIPIVNLFTLGYLLDVQGRVGRTGKLKQAFPLLNVAPRFGAIVLGIWLWVFPLRLLAGAAIDAHLISPGSSSDIVLHRVTSIASVLVYLHLVLALARGGAFSCFFRPIKNVLWLFSQIRNEQYLDSASEHIKSFVADLRIRHHFSLGFRGFIGAGVWLFIPTVMLASSNKPAGGNAQFGVTIIGGFLLAIVLCWLPALQTRFAVENRFKAFFELKTIRNTMAKRPLLWLIALLLTYALSLPLNLFKIVTPPADAMWFITLIFIIGIYPTKVLLGWVYHYSHKKETSPHFLWRLPMGWLEIPMLCFYVFLFFFTQFIGEHGKMVLFQNHVFLLPIPF